MVVLKLGGLAMSTTATVLDAACVAMAQERFEMGLAVKRSGCR